MINAALRAASDIALDGPTVSACLDFHARPGDLLFALAWTRSLRALAPHERTGAPRRCHGTRHPIRDGVVVSQLDQFSPGARVHVALHPLTPAASGEPVFARLYTRHPRMTVAHVRPYTAIRYATDGLYLQVTFPAALAAIKGAGCESTVLE